jgi:hypothetical protein
MGHGLQDCGCLNDLAAEAIQDLRSQGCVVTDSDICRLNALAWHIQTPGLQRELSKGRPVQCGNVWLWPRSMLACAWFDDQGCRHSDPEMALAYAMAHSHNEALATATETQVESWGRTVVATRQQLRIAIGEVLAQGRDDEQPPSGDPAPSLGDLSAILVASCGGRPDDWERLVSLEYASAMLTTHTAQQSAAGRSGISPQVARAERAFGWAICKIRRRGKAE